MLQVSSSRFQIILATACCWLLVAVPASAAQLYFGTHAREVGLGQAFEVGVFLNTTGASVNAVEGKVTFPVDELELKDVLDGNSAVNLWVERPRLVSPGVVSFSGIIPGGYQGDGAYLFSLVLQGSELGQVSFSTSEERLLLNDGRGTPAPVDRAPLTLKVVRTSGAEAFLPPYDTEPPEPFIPTVGRDPALYNGQWFVVFASQDKGLGLDHYEIQERSAAMSFKALRGGEQPWLRAVSPYVLQNQRLSSTVYLRAVDRAGNERTVVLPPSGSPAWYDNYLIWSIIVVVGTAITYLAWKNVWPARKPSNTNPHK